MANYNNPYGVSDDLYQKALASVGAAPVAPKTVSPAGFDSGAADWANQLNSYAYSNQQKEYESKLQQAIQKMQYDDQRQQSLTGANDPYLLSLKALLSNPGKAMDSNPIFKWQQQQWEQAVNRAAAARGQLGSGNRMMALSDYAQNQSGNQFFTLADLYAKLGQQGVENYKAMYGLDNQKYGIDAQSASAANSLNFEKNKFSTMLDLFQQEQQGIQAGMNQASRDALRAQYEGLTRSGAAEIAHNIENSYGNDGYLSDPRYQKYNAWASSAPLFY